MNAADTETEQEEAIAFLGDPANHDPRPETVERIDTHGAIVFLAGERVYKIKRAVELPYFDFSTLEKRRAACEREVELNRETAPSLYRGVVPLVRRDDGALALGGEGETVEWVVEMVRFDQADLLEQMAAAGRLPLSLMAPLADHIAAYHARAPAHRGGDGVAAFADVIEEVAAALEQAQDRLGEEAVQHYARALKERFETDRALLARREEAGRVRRCHGDLHLRNIVLIDGAPALFDALEFDERLATIDVLYDLAFLLMDLWLRGERAHANAVLNRYLWRADADADIDGLAALPLFLSVRAAIRAMVGLDRLAQVSGEEAETALAEVQNYFALAREFLTPPGPRLIAVGGLSGTGKTTLAAGLAPLSGPAPGAFHLRSDVERKLLFGVAPEDRLDAGAYTQKITKRVYAILNAKAARALAAGHAVILDAVFAKPSQRAAAEDVAQTAGAPFDGLWLSAPESALTARVDAREGDASDADARVVRQQLKDDVGEIGWRRIDAGGPPDSVRAEAARRLGLTREDGK